MHTSLWLVVLSMIESFGVIGNQESGVVSHNWRQKREERENQAERVSGGQMSDMTFQALHYHCSLDRYCQLVSVLCCIGNQVEASCKREKTKNFRGENREERDFQRERETREREREHVEGVNCVSFITFPSFSSLSSLFLSSFCLSFLFFSPFSHAFVITSGTIGFNEGGQTKKDEARNGECSNLLEREPKGENRKTNPLLASLSSLESVFSLLEWPTDRNAGIGRRRRLLIKWEYFVTALSLSLFPSFLLIESPTLSLSLFPYDARGKQDVYLSVIVLPTKRKEPPQFFELV